jgi:hypothetical protein
LRIKDSLTKEWGLMKTYPLNEAQAEFSQLVERAWKASLGE